MPAPAKKVAAKKRSIEVESSDSSDTDDDKIKKGKVGQKEKKTKAAAPAPAKKKTPPASKDQIQMIGVMRKVDMVFLATFFQKSKKFTVKDKKSVKEAVKSCVEATKKPKAGQKYATEGENFNINFTFDKGTACIFAIVTDKVYSPRLSFAVLDKVRDAFAGKVDKDRIEGGKDEGLSKQCNDFLSSIYADNTDPAECDKLSAVQSKIDIVMNKMQDNIQLALANTKMMENIEEKSEDVLEKTIVFRRDAKALKDKMWWKMIKMRLLIGFLVASVLIIIITVPIVTSQQAQAAQKKQQ